MTLALFYTQPTLNRLFNNCIKISSSWNLKKGGGGWARKRGGGSGQKKTTFKIQALLGLRASNNLSNFKGVRIIPMLFYSSEIHLFQTVYFQSTCKQTNKGYKEDLVDAVCFLNMTTYTTFSIYSYFLCLIKDT